MPEVIQILADSNLENVTSEDKNIFIKLLIQKFLSKPRNIMTDNWASAELANLVQKIDENLYTYYYWTKRFLKRIYKQDQVTNNGRETITLCLPEQ